MDGLAPASTGPVTGPQFDNRRVLAALIDLLLLVPVALVMSMLFGGFTTAAALLTWGWALYYYFALESDHGQTIGKRVMKLRVARADGQPLDTGRVAVRTLLRPIDAIGAYLVGIIVMIATGQRRQRIGDLAAGTVVTDAGAPEPTAPQEQVKETHVEAPEPPVIEPPSMPAPNAPAADTGLDANAVPEVKPFEPFAEAAEAAPAPEMQPEPMPEMGPPPLPELPPLPDPDPVAGPPPLLELPPLEPEPVAEVDAPPAPAREDIVPVDRPEEAEPATKEPVPVPEPEAEEEPGEPKPSGMEIVSSPIDLVMEDDDEEPTPPQA